MLLLLYDKELTRDCTKAINIYKRNFYKNGHKIYIKSMLIYNKNYIIYYIIHNIYIHTTRHIYHNIKNILTIKHDQTLPYFLFSKLCRDRDHK